MKKILNSVKKSLNVVCVLRDKVGNTYGAPSAFINNAVAVRSFGDLMSTDIYSKHREDYELICIGSYDIQTGVLESCPHSVLARGVDFVD